MWPSLIFQLLYQGTVLDGHALILQLCNVKKDEPLTKNTENDRSSTKLIVRNVAFQATEKDLRQLFSPFGQVLTHVFVLHDESDLFICLLFILFSTPSVLLKYPLCFFGEVPLINI